MSNDIYNSKILEYAGNIPRIGRLNSPTVTASAHSKLCGSTITVDLQLENDVIVDYAHEVKACALGQASASIVASNIVGATRSELLELQATMHAMLKENGSPPVGRFAALEFLTPVREYKARHASTLLVFDAIVRALETGNA